MYIIDIDQSKENLIIVLVTLHSGWPSRYFVTVPLSIHRDTREGYSFSFTRKPSKGKIFVCSRRDHVANSLARSFQIAASWPICQSCSECTIRTGNSSNPCQPHPCLPLPVSCLVANTSISQRLSSTFFYHHRISHPSRALISAYL